MKPLLYTHILLIISFTKLCGNAFHRRVRLCTALIPHGTLYTTFEFPQFELDYSTNGYTITRNVRKILHAHYELVSVWSLMRMQVFSSIFFLYFCNVTSEPWKWKTSQISLHMQFTFSSDTQWKSTEQIVNQGVGSYWKI